MLEAPVFLKALLKIIRELQERGRISPDTSPLPPEQLAGFREELEAELRRLERSMLVSDEGLKPVEVDPGTTGRLSRMDELQSQAMIDRLEVFPEVATCIACTA